MRVNTPGMTVLNQLVKQPLLLQKMLSNTGVLGSRQRL